MRAQAEAIRRGLQVQLQLGLLDVSTREIKPRIGERVQRLRGVHLRARIHVVPPRPTNPRLLLEDREIPQPQLPHAHPHGHATRTSPDDRHPRGNRTVTILSLSMGNTHVMKPPNTRDQCPLL